MENHKIAVLDTSTARNIKWVPTGNDLEESDEGHSVYSVVLYTEWPSLYICLVWVSEPPPCARGGDLWAAECSN